MLQLPNGCSCSIPTVYPKNWQSGGNVLLKLEWRIQYYFRDPVIQDKNKYGKLQIVKGMNAFKTLPERRLATKNLIDNELRMLLEEGYNPITKSRIAPINIDYEIDPSTLIIPALEKVCEKLKIPEYTKKSVVSALKYISKSIKLSKLSDLQIKNVSRRHVVAILDNCEQVAVKWSATNYNHYRAYLMMMFNKLVQLEAMETNPVLNIDKQSMIIKYKRVLTEDERKKIDRHFKANDTNFRRFLHIFFHSGSRPIKLLQLKKEDVNLDSLHFKILVKKGQINREEVRPIKEIAAVFWRELVKEAKPDQYLFGRKLKPGNKPTTKDFITKKWQREVKQKLKIPVDIYSLKHLNLDETAALLSVEDAS